MNINASKWLVLCLFLLSFHLQGAVIIGSEAEQSGHLEDDNDCLLREGLFSHYHPFFKKRHKKPMHLVCITIPKSGTHLLHKCLVLLNLEGFHHPEKDGVSSDFVAKVRALNQLPPPNHYRGLFHIPTVGPVPEKIARRLKEKTTPHSFWSHWPYTTESESLFNEYAKANFFMIRDPRDQLISMAFMVLKGPNGETADFEQAVLDLITGEQKQYIQWAVEIQTAHPLMWELGVVQFYELYLPWMQSKKMCTVKFENLVGPNGGTPLIRQINEIKKIAKHVGVTLNDLEANKISKDLFGGTLTFRQGQIGAWKQYFTPRIKQAFKDAPGASQLLVDLGYEKNFEW